jgi:predicted nuclease of restriction endonuclease-like (RecB) superfamily
MPRKSVEKQQTMKRKPVKSLIAGYEEFLGDLKTRIRSAQIKAALAVNSEMISLYWEIGKGIVERQEKALWGDEVLGKLSRELMHEFPEMKGFSQSNIYRMRAFYFAYQKQKEFFPQVVGKIPWGHHHVIIEKVKELDVRLWYMQQTIENGWSRNVLRHHIETNLYRRQTATDKTTNFSRTLPPLHSDLVEQTIKDEYIFDFLTLRRDAHERELERGLLERLRDFLLELGKGFAFLGSQYHLEVGGQDFYIDLLFYHHRLRCLVAIDLKMNDFQPADAGQMNFYLSALDDLVRHPEDKPSVGIILCKGRNRAVAEYALRDIAKPLGVSAFKTKELTDALPSVKELERMLNEEIKA